MKGLTANFECEVQITQKELIANLRHQNTTLDSCGECYINKDTQKLFLVDSAGF